jgi:hypothetical protein
MVFDLSKIEYFHSRVHGLLGKIQQDLDEGLLLFAPDEDGVEIKVNDLLLETEDRYTKNFKVSKIFYKFNTYSKKWEIVDYTL